MNIFPVAHPLSYVSQLMSSSTANSSCTREKFLITLSDSRMSVVTYAQHEAQSCRWLCTRPMTFGTSFQLKFFGNAILVASDRPSIPLAALSVRRFIR